MITTATDAAPIPSQSDRLPVDKLPRLLHLQILRALAASLVVLEHAVDDLTIRGLLPQSALPHASILGGLGVAAFFILSGQIMVRQSATLFGAKGGPLLFAWHRILRIVPMYWLATLAWTATLLLRSTPVRELRTQLVCSLFFIPNFTSPTHQMLPLLPQGWTLNYEMAFYLLFALCLFLPRRFGLPVLLAILFAAAALLHPHNPFSGSTSLRLWNFFTDAALLLFAFGVLIGAVELRFAARPRHFLALSPAFLLLLPAPILLLHLAHPRSPTLWIPLGLFCALVVALCTLTNVSPIGPTNRTLILLGDASYSTYLCHLWPIGWLTSATFFSNHPVIFVLACIATANLLGLFVHLLIERPITSALRRHSLRPSLRPSL